MGFRQSPFGPSGAQRLPPKGLVRVAGALLALRVLPARRTRRTGARAVSAPHPGPLRRASSEGCMPLGINKPSLGRVGTGSGGCAHSDKASCGHCNIHRPRAGPRFGKRLPKASHGPKGNGSELTGQRGDSWWQGPPVSWPWPGFLVPGCWDARWARGWSLGLLGGGRPRLQEPPLGETGRAAPAPQRAGRLTPTGSPAPRLRKT